jgi:hypothetical protein
MSRFEVTYTVTSGYYRQVTATDDAEAIEKVKQSLLENGIQADANSFMIRSIE